MRIRFTHNWNEKLGWKLFTTIRMNSPYHKAGIDREYDIILKNKKHAKAILLDVHTYNSLSKVPKFLIETDTGLGYEKAISMFRKTFGVSLSDPVDVLLFLNLKV